MDDSSAPDTSQPETTVPPESSATNSSGDFCALNDEIARLFGVLASQRGADAEATWREIEAVVEQMPGAAPPEPVDDVNGGLRYHVALDEALEATNFDPTAAVESLPADPELDQIEARTSEYLASNCGT